MAKQSAGVLAFRRTNAQLEVLLIHPGGPFWAHKDNRAWSIPKGEFDDGDDPLDAAKREFEEETGSKPEGEFIPLGSLRQPGGKVVHAWAMEHDFDPHDLRSNTFSMEWPPKSGRICEFPEVDKAAWFSNEEARHKILPGQVPFLERMLGALGQDFTRP